MSGNENGRRGWSGIEAARRQAERPPPAVMSDAEKAAEAALRRWAGTDGGRAFMAWLRSVTVERETCHPLQLPKADRETRVDYAHFREGQNSICRMMQMMIDGEEVKDV